MYHATALISEFTSDPSDNRKNCPTSNAVFFSLRYNCEKKYDYYHSEKSEEKRGNFFLQDKNLIGKVRTRVN